MNSQVVHAGIASMTLQTLVFTRDGKARATRLCALQKHKLQMLGLHFTSSKIKYNLCLPPVQNVDI